MTEPSEGIFRKDLIDLLRDRPLTLHDIAQLLGTTSRDVESALGHLKRSLRHTTHRLKVTPARCRRCGFTFRADKLHKPGKCPTCHHSWIRAPRVWVEERSQP